MRVMLRGCSQDASIVRHRGKIEAVINNARRALELIESEGSIARYVWRFEPAPRTGRLDHAALTELSATAESKALARTQCRLSVVGPTTVYAFMQAMGLVNDHLDGCDVRPRVDEARNAFERP